MSEQIVSSLITGDTSIISAIILTLGIYIIARHRKTVINLRDNIQRYHELEQKLVSINLELNNEKVYDNMIKKILRSAAQKILGHYTFDSMMTAREAENI